MVRVKGVEPPRLAALDPKSSASANSATPANLMIIFAKAKKIESYFHYRKKTMVSHEGLEPSTL